MAILPENKDQIYRILQPTHRKEVEANIRAVKTWAEFFLQTKTCVLCGCLLIDTASLADHLAKKLQLQHEAIQEINRLLGLFVFKFLGQGHWDSVPPESNICSSCERDDD